MLASKLSKRPLDLGLVLINKLRHQEKLRSNTGSLHFSNLNRLNNNFKSLRIKHFRFKSKLDKKLQGLGLAHKSKQKLPSELEKSLSKISSAKTKSFVLLNNKRKELFIRLENLQDRKQLDLALMLSSKKMLLGKLKIKCEWMLSSLMLVLGRLKLGLGWLALAQIKQQGINNLKRLECLADLANKISKWLMKG